MDYQKLCEDVLNIDSQIRFVGILNSRGDLPIQKNRNDSSLLSDDEVKMSIHYTFERWNKVQNLEHKLGKEKASITEYENVTLISLILGRDLLLLSIQPGASYQGIISKVNEVISKQ